MIYYQLALSTYTISTILKWKMNVYFSDIFKNGHNDGDVVIVSVDDTEIKCHSIVLETTTEYMKTLKSFRKNANDTSVKIKLQHKPNIIVLVLNKLYNSDYDPKICDVDIIFESVQLVDELQVIPKVREKIIEDITKKFNEKISKEN